MAPQEAEQLIKILANYCDPPFPEQEAIRKVASAFKEARNLAQEIRDLISGTSGGLRVTEVDKILGIGTNRDKENRKKIFQRLVAEGRLEKTGAGLYRVVQAESAGIDFLNADTGGPLPVKWPFGIEQLVNIYKKILL
jgi:hypothetical protein